MPKVVLDNAPAPKAPLTNSGVLKQTQAPLARTAIPGINTPLNAPVAAPKAVAATPAPAPVANAAQALLSGGGSGGGSAGGATSPAAAAPSLQDYINSNFLYQQQQGANDDALNNYDAQTLQQTQDTQAQQALKEQQLSQQQNQLGQTNADNLAAHGLLDSGINFQNQDKIDANGNTQQAAIDSLLTNLTSTRAQGRVTQQQANQTALNTVMNQLAQQYAGTQSAAV
jgi:hypothetical protein